MPIVSTPGVRFGSSRVEGTRITVMDVHTQVIRFDHAPVVVADKFEITLSEVHEALSYYYDNPDEMRAERKEIESARQRVRENSLSPPD